jgi:hypothetical protein
MRQPGNARGLGRAMKGAAEEQATRLKPDLPAIAVMDPDTPVAGTEIMALLGVTRSGWEGWRSRKLLPEADWPVGGRPAWRWGTIEAWARRTGRLPALPEAS